MDWGDCVIGTADASAPTISCLEPLFANIVSVITLITVVALFVILIVGGYKYLTSGGDPKKVEESKGTLTAAAIGFIIVIAAFLVIGVFANFLGLESLKSFRIKFPTTIPLDLPSNVPDRNDPNLDAF